MEIMLKNVRLGPFAELFRAKEFKVGDGKPRWSAALVIDAGSENDKFIRNAIEAEAKNVHGDKAVKWLASIAGQKNQYCYLDGASKGESFEGKWVLSTHRSAKLARPLIIDRDKSPLTADDAKPYPGCFVNAKVEIYAQKGENAGMRASFSVIQFAADGEAFGSFTPSADGFDDITAGADADSLV